MRVYQQFVQAVCALHAYNDGQHCPRFGPGLDRLDSRCFCYAGASTTDPSESFSSLKRLAEGSAGTAEGRRSLRRRGGVLNLRTFLAALSPPLSRPHVQHTGDGCGHVVEVHVQGNQSQAYLQSCCSTCRVQVLCAGDLSIRLARVVPGNGFSDGGAD